MPAPTSIRLTVLLPTLCPRFFIAPTMRVYVFVADTTVSKLPSLHYARTCEPTAVVVMRWSRQPALIGSTR
jgi:hypothetical protein